ncbi:MAG: PASTA domain-containing protein [Actinomycetota bacterium]
MSRPAAEAIRLVLCVAAPAALLVAGCASSAGTRGSGESPKFNAGGPMEVHASPTEAAGEQIRVPDVEGEDWEDAAHTVLDAGFEFGTWSRSPTATPGGR